MRSVVFIGGEKALESSEKTVKQVLDKAGIRLTGTVIYGKDSTQTAIDKLISTPIVQEADVIFGFGGGRALDTAKMVAKELDKEIITFPTVCSNCSAGTAIAVIYNDDHSLLKYGYPNTPLHIFINTEVIAQAPSKYFWAGIGDGISKGPEVERAVKEAQYRGVCLSHTANLGLAIAKSSKDAFYHYGSQGLQDVKQQRCSKAVEEIALDIIVSTGYASNLTNQPDFFYNTCHAHAFYNATTAISRGGEHLHGAVVAFGVMVLHAYFDEWEDLERVACFNQSLGLPICLADIGLSQEHIPKLVEVAMTTNEYQHTPFDAETYAQAIAKADSFGQSLH